MHPCTCTTSHVASTEQPSRRSNILCRMRLIYGKSETSICSCQRVHHLFIIYIACKPQLRNLHHSGGKLMMKDVFLVLNPCMMEAMSCRHPILGVAWRQACPLRSALAEPPQPDAATEQLHAGKFVLQLILLISS